MKGADINYNNISTNPSTLERRNEALLDAAERGLTHRLRALLRSGADVDYYEPGDSGRTAIWYAADAGFTEGVKMLIEAGSDINTSNRNGLTPLIQAVCKNAYDTVQLLLTTEGIDKGAKTAGGCTALHLAAGDNNVEVMTLLIEHGCRVDVLSSSMQTPLHHVCNVDAARFLVEAGASITVKSKYGETPVEKARRNYRRPVNYDETDLREMIVYLESVEAERKR